MKKRNIFEKGFTLVELLIVIALIAILSVAVLATINPIEQSNKARDARVQNDAAEVMNAYERYYASQQDYPWTYFTGGDGIGAAAAVLLRSDTYGFGICAGDPLSAEALLLADASAVAGSCSAADDFPNLLISSSELKSSFAGKDEFEPVVDGTHPEYALWTAKVADGNSLYVCYIPKAKANKIDATKMRCINTLGQVIESGSGTCTVAVDSWDLPVTDGTEAMFRCVPE